MEKKKKEQEDLIETVIFIRDYIMEHMATKEDLAEVRAEMVTKGEFASFRAEMAAFRTETESQLMWLRTEIRAIHTRLDEMQAELNNHGGFAKEIDHLLGRVQTIEQHLGIKLHAAVA